MVNFFCGEAISFTLILQSLDSFSSFKKEDSVLVFSTVQRITLVLNTTHFHSGISQIPRSNRKPEHLRFKASKGSRRRSFSSYVLKCTELAGERVPTYVYLSLICFNQGSCKLAPCVFSVNWLLLSFRFQKMLEAPSKDVVCQKTYQNKSFFKNVSFSNLWNSSPPSFIPQGASSEEMDGTN